MQNTFVGEWQQDAAFLARGTKEVYDTYLSGEKPHLALSFAMTLLVNTISLMPENTRAAAFDDVFASLEGYEQQFIDRNSDEV